MLIECIHGCNNSGAHWVLKIHHQCFSDLFVKENFLVSILPSFRVSYGFSFCLSCLLYGHIKHHCFSVISPSVIFSLQSFNELNSIQRFWCSTYCRRNKAGILLCSDACLAWTFSAKIDSLWGLLIHVFFHLLVRFSLSGCYLFIHNHICSH